MPRIFDNIDQHLAPALRTALVDARSADFCVGYFNLRGWGVLADAVEALAPQEAPCRLLIGMQRAPKELRRALHGAGAAEEPIDQQRAILARRQITEEFREQLASGVPSRQDEATLRLLARQLREGRVRVRLYLREPLHAKLYLVHRRDAVNPRVGFLGSSNLTFSGLRGQGELNVDVMEVDACDKLARWFEDRWNDRFSLDVSEDLARAIDESWAGERLVPPFHVYLKIAWHLSRDARAGLSEFRIPGDIEPLLFDFQKAAVKIAAHHVQARGGVMLGDVVGLGKTLMATALARVLEDELGYSTLIVCPKNLTPMWQAYVERYRLHARVLSLSMAQRVLPTLRRFPLVVVDESHNLRNREGRRYRALYDYIRRNESRCVLLTATPYNKTYLDLGSQLRLFVPEDRDLGIRPEGLLGRIGGESAFLQQHQCSPRSLAAFEKSEQVDDWRDLMRLYLVRRTRSFIRRHYAESDPETGRRYLRMPDGTRAYFPDRVPRNVPFVLDERAPDDTYARLYADDVVQTLTSLELPRYGLGNHVRKEAAAQATPAERPVLAGLSKAGRRLQGFCLVNLFKRLESSGVAFLRSVERHVLRNHIFLEALRQGDELPVGPQESELLDGALADTDPDTSALPEPDDDEDAPAPDQPLAGEAAALLLGDIAGETYAARARRVLDVYRAQGGKYARRFRWVRTALFKNTLAAALKRDTEKLVALLERAGTWEPARDEKLAALEALLSEAHPTEKVLVFTQFADTAVYLHRELLARGVVGAACVTGDSDDPTAIARRFSPRSNEVTLPPGDEIRVLVTTDLLSEGQNLQDAAIVVNYDLPWAVIRLVQRAGRVDRIGQQAPTVTCYSFLPSQGVERLLRLRARMRQRLEENAEVVGTDEAFFDDDNTRQIVDLYHEKAGILDGRDDVDVDLGSQALQIWNDSIAADPSLEASIRKLQPVVYSTRERRPEDTRPPGVIVFIRTAHDTDALAYVDEEGRTITGSPQEVLRLAACRADTPALPPREDHHALVAGGVERIALEEATSGGQLGSRAGPRYKVYERLKRLLNARQGSLFAPGLQAALDAIYRQPLQASAAEALSRQLRAGTDDAALGDFVMLLHEEGRLCFSPDQSADGPREPIIVCSMGIR
ncbi:MAG TPA: helicase-related protein [Candidatus Nanopelagicales bacterium]|nr:helicase-related protein [Candidatus Nanopelagicales bacterium]